jgi:penicillin-binding protein 1A
VPIFIEFMKEALKGAPKLDFVAPPGTVFAEVGPNREAFQPGTEPGAGVHLGAPGGGGTGGAAPSGSGAPATPTAPNPPPGPVKATKPDDMSGLF